MMKQLLTKDICFARLPVRLANSHKGSHGKALCLCGSSAYRGAAALSCLGALRTGAGLVTLAAPETVIASIACRIVEATFIPLPDDAALFAAANNCTVLLAGCGLPQNFETAAMLRSLLPQCGGKIILDAGALCSLAADSATLQKADIITPHIGEMAKLCGCTAAEITAQPQKFSLSFAQETNTVVVLKSHRTLIASPDGQLYENQTGNAGLARGGSGDVLAGMIAGLLAQGLDCFDAALCGVYLHGAAADACAARKSQHGMLPEDILEDVCNLFIAFEAQKC